MRAISQEDTALDTLLEEANKFTWLRDDNEVVIEAVPEPPSAASAFLFNRARDGDSVSTFHPNARDPENHPTKKSKVSYNCRCTVYSSRIFTHIKMKSNY